MYLSGYLSIYHLSIQAYICILWAYRFFFNFGCVIYFLLKCFCLASREIIQLQTVTLWHTQSLDFWTLPHFPDLNILRFILNFNCPNNRISYFFKQSWGSSYSWMVLQNKIWALVMFIGNANNDCSKLSQLSELYIIYKYFCM